MTQRKTLTAPVLWLGVILLWLANAGLAEANSVADRHQAAVTSTSLAGFGTLPLSFVENQGQMTSPVSFYTVGPGLQAGFGPGEITLAFPAGKPDGPIPAARRSPDPNRNGAASARRPCQMVRLYPVNISPAVTLTGADPMPGKFNHYLGRDPARWRTGLPVYGSVLYRQAYPGVDLRFYGQGQALEYDVVVQPGANPSQVRFRLEGIQKLALTSTGDLDVTLPGGRRFLQKKPLVYQEVDSRRLVREGQFKLYPKGSAWEYGFEVAAYDRTRPLIIDPVLVYSTYWGGSSSDTAMNITTDASGYAFVVGYTQSSDFLTYPGSTFKGGTDVFVLKLNPTGKAMIFSTLLGGDSTDEGYGIDLDQNGNPCICGRTYSDHFPLAGDPWQGTRKGSFDAFVARLSGVNGALLYSTYLGGQYEDRAIDLKVDRFSGNMYVVGSTRSNDMFTTPVRAYQNGWDVFVAQIDSIGGLGWSTYLGGSSDDYGKAVALDKYSHIYITGDTSSSDFPKQDEILGYQGSGDAFVTQISSYSGGVVFSTFLGGTNSDYGVDLAVSSYYNDDDELVTHIYITGQTRSADFPHEQSIRPLQGSYDVFLTRLSRYYKIYPTNYYIGYSAFLGGTKLDFGNALALDRRGRVYLTGTTYSSDFYLKKPWSQYDGGGLRGVTDAFVAKFNAVPYDKDDLIYSTYLGGSGYESGLGIALDSADNLFITGNTTSGDFHTKNPLVGYWAGGDLFVTKVGMELPSNAPIMLLLLAE